MIAVADPVTNWIDARIQAGVKAAIDAAFEQEHERADEIADLIVSLPGSIAQAMGNLFPHFLHHLAALPPVERDTLLEQYATRAVQTPDDLAVHRKRIRDPEGG